MNVIFIFKIIFLMVTCFYITYFYRNFLGRCRIFMIKEPFIGSYLKAVITIVGLGWFVATILNYCKGV